MHFLLGALHIKVDKMKKSKMKVVLVEPEIPFNTGSIGRTCVAVDLELILVGKLGFSLDSII